MANEISIVKKSGGTILVVNTNGTEYNLLPGYRLQKTSDSKVNILTDLGGLIDTLDPVTVEKIVLIDGTEILIPDVATLFLQLYTNFFNPSDLTQVLQVDEDDEGGGVTTTYIGSALPGTLTAAAKWQIKKMVETEGGNDFDTVIQFAESGGVADTGFKFVWNDRLGLAYL